MSDTRPLRSVTPTIDIYIKLAQYPILCDLIRVRMREELFRRGIITQKEFESEVKRKAMESQRREGLMDPYSQEEANIWNKRKERIRDFQTDAYFANNLGSPVLEAIIDEVLYSQPSTSHGPELKFNPEIAPWELLFQQGEIYETLPPQEQEQVHHHLQEIKVVLIKRMISDQLPFIAVAKQVFVMSDLRRIYQRLIGTGKIGGKAAGMMLAWRILQQKDPEFGPDMSNQVGIPDSYFIGSEVIYEFRLANKLNNFMNQKYRPLDEIRKQYPVAVQAHLDGQFSEAVVDQLREVLMHMGNDPLIVRSSSLLEDNFGFSFAGKYHSYFLPNQASFEENLAALLEAIKRIYASTLNPDALLYRRHHGLIDYDERMAILLQRVRGKQYGRYFMPTLAGVAFSQNPFRWNAKIRREDGFIRLVWGLGTRAVDRVENDFPRMIALSHPRLRPETTARAIRQYSQWHVDLIDLEDNTFKTMPVRDVLKPDYPELRYIASQDKGDYLQSIMAAGMVKPSDRLVLTFDTLTKDAQFVKLLRTALRRLESGYKTPVDTEFTVEIVENYPYPDYKLHILQCRPLSQRTDEQTAVPIPTDIPEPDTLFRAYEMVPDGRAEGVRYIIFVDPEAYYTIPDTATRSDLGRAIGHLNKLLEDEIFILMGPGRWGSTNIELGVPVSYADIYNTKVLIEMAVVKDGQSPELSYGTHFFQDLVESGIYSLPLHLGDGKGLFNWDFFRNAPNCLSSISPKDARLADYLKVIDVTAVAGDHRRVNILMNGITDEAIAFLVTGEWPRNDTKKGQVSHF
ncbi:MAG: PEP/pyruvate-binding domain-containing protein [Ardenticatenaceae bacterium]|nr:PEP/pyruvate-binding domain-containing protein [Ardenticatenaceae bacterium]MCB8991640.1 PEP/pyruvate-binding domain-containing protein [Ardenticatenaceae bacterium]MCB9002737.1 PEP/pyruvate-binding domain-containing protein [Ardenticatenaceae bacterium]